MGAAVRPSVACQFKEMAIECPLSMIIPIKAHIPLKIAFASANSRVANAENDAQTT